MALTAMELRLQFFDYLFDEQDGFLCIAFRSAKSSNNKDFKQQFFSWPSQREAMGAFIETTRVKNNVWFGVNLFRRPERKRDYALPTRLVWADLDFCNPAEVTPAPQCRIESSPQRFQALWRLQEKIDPLIAQAYSKRIAYAYADKGADKSGWDAEQLLRVPYTYNFKYDNGAEVPEVKLLSSFDALLPLQVFEEVTEARPEEKVDQAEPMPDILALPDTQNVLYAHRNELRRTAFAELYDEEPSSDWSGAMWRLINICLEAGMSTEEAFAVALSSKCNKYERDDRPISLLWREVLKADLKQRQFQIIVGDPLPLLMPTLYEGDPPESVIDQYKDWAVEATDAVEEYHELACTILLSSLAASGLYLNTSFGKVIPNLWGLILGDSTLTRKTTAMKMAMQFLGDIDREVVVATDGSAEGILTALAGRPGQVSVYFKDEVSGFIDSINRKDYLAGMPETLTQLYDVPEFFHRRLRKETITITKPVFIFFGGGIRDKMYSLLSDEFILSGFLPRFLIVGGNADIDKIRAATPLGPDLAEKRRLLREKFTEFYLTYNTDVQVEIPGTESSFNIPAETQVELTDDAWKYFQEIQMKLTKAAINSAFEMVAQPTFERLAWSTAKMAMLYGAIRQEPKDGKITVGIKDLQAAAYYAQRWGIHTVDLITNVGRTANQRILDRVMDHVRRRPGCTRSEIARHHHLLKRELDLVLETLLDRDQVRIEKKGNGWLIHPI